MSKIKNPTGKGGFKKGQSGNPGGRQKEDCELKEIAKAYTLEAVERLVYWMRSDNAKASVGASSIILDRGWGKAPQQVDANVGGKLVVSWQE
jgi:hypothetical protein